MYLPHRHRAGTVYSSGLRRCLIIFAPRTHILDRRTSTCRTPSLPVVLQRSKNFTSGVAIPFTPSCPIVDDRHSPPTSRVGHRRQTAAMPSAGAGTGPRSPRWAPRPAQLHKPTSGRCFDIPWTDIQPRLGCVGHTEFSRVAEAVGSGGGPRAWSAWHGAAPLAMSTHKPWVYNRIDLH